MVIAMQSLATLLDRYPRARAEIARNYRNHRWERAAPHQVRIGGGMGLVIGGHAETFLNGGPRRVDPNLLTDQGINYLLGVGINDQTKVATWYLAPFAGAVNPTAGLTAANFTSTLTEFTAYDESTRREYVDVPGTKLMTNAASPAVITISTDSSTVWGFGVLSAAAKSATTGTCLAAIRFSAARSGMLDGDTLGAIYIITGADDGV